MILAIDPSIRHVGWAVYFKGEWAGGTMEFPDDYYNYDLGYLICIKLDSLSPVKWRQLDVLILEEPTFMSSTKGQIAAQQGYTLNLAFINGYIASHFRRSRYKPKIVQYTPRQWKGQVPKSATLAKFKREFSDIDTSKLTDHEIDARMMIQYYLTNK